MQFNYRPNSSSSIGSDRLRKAIERNKSKQTKRTSKKALKTSSASATRYSVARSANESIIDQPLKRKSKKSFSFLFGKPKVKTPARKSTKRKLDLPIPMWLRRVAWAFCILVFARLMFSDRGLIDYYSRKNIYENHLRDFENIKIENTDINNEIDLIHSNYSYQRKLVRDNLGFISNDEFLILFAKD